SGEGIKSVAVGIRLVRELSIDAYGIEHDFRFADLLSGEKSANQDAILFELLRCLTQICRFTIERSRPFNDVRFKILHSIARNADGLRYVVFISVGRRKYTGEGNDGDSRND